MDKTLEIILALVIIGVTLDFGGVQPLTYSLVEVVLFLALVLLLFKRTRQNKMVLPLPLWPVLFGLLIALQTIPIPPALVVRLSPARILDSDLGSSVVQGYRAWKPLSIYPHGTVLALVKILAYLCAFLLAAYLFDSRKRKSTLLLALISLGGFEAAYGIVQYLTGWQKIFMFTKQSYTQEATGTYINHNHFAGFLELTLSFAVASVFYFFQIWSESRHAGPGRHVPKTSSSAGFQSIFYLFLLVIMVVGVVFSRSRGGILATVFTVVFVAMLAQLKSRRKVWTLGVFFFLICVVGYGIWIGLDPVLARFEQIQAPGYLQMEGRISTWRDALRLVRDYPLMGTGLGTFGLSFRRYQTAMVNFYFEHAHNDYLEFASDTGLVGVALLFLPIMYLLARMIISFLDDPRRYRRAVTLGCIGSTLALLLHSITDFNLQIPANALIFAVVLGIGYKVACIERREEEEQTGFRPDAS